MPGLLDFGQIKACDTEKSLLYAVPTIWPPSLMPSAVPLLNSPVVLRMTAGLELLAQINGARLGEVGVVCVANHAAHVVECRSDLRP